MDFTDTVVLLTGATSGIGTTCALHFAKHFAKLALVGNNIEELNDVSKRIIKIEGTSQPLLIRADLESDNDMQRVVDETLAEYGRIDVLINNAGTGMSGSLTDGVSPFDSVMKSSLRSVYVLANYAIPHLIMATGTIVNISSAASTFPEPEFLPYSMAKAALDMFTKCLAKEFGVDGIRVNSVNPGPVKFVNEIASKEDDITMFYKKRVRECPLGKIATNIDVADVVLFLASDKSKSITGCVHFVDNGMLLGQM